MYIVQLYKDWTCKCVSGSSGAVACLPAVAFMLWAPASQVSQCVRVLCIDGNLVGIKAFWFNYLGQNYLSVFTM